ncbi:universal stress protein [bacterium]|nr:MAG: universal stress protein [bacterium]
MYSRILVAIDENPASERAVEHAAGLAKALSATLRILHVVDMGWLTLGPELAVDVETNAQARRTAGERLLSSARDRARAAGVEAEIKLGETGAPMERIATEITDEAARWPADMVVLGTHGRRGVERLVLGSVAEGVARQSAIPVLLIPQA